MEKGRDRILSGKLKYSPWEEYYFTTLSVFFYFPSLICPLYGGKKYMIWKFGKNSWCFLLWETAWPRRICVPCMLCWSLNLTDLHQYHLWQLGFSFPSFVLEGPFCFYANLAAYLGLPIIKVIFWPWYLLLILYLSLFRIWGESRTVLYWGGPLKIPSAQKLLSIGNSLPYFLAFSIEDIIYFLLC